MEPAERFAGCLIGTMLGDSLLLPAEGLSRRRIAQRFTGELRQRLAFGRGMASDDTEHAFLTAQALLAAGGDAERFARALASRLRWWLLSLPGGCGKATACGLLRSWAGVPPSRSGIHSAGNGPAMRSAIIGVRCSADHERLRAFVAGSTAITHRDGRALTAALAVAMTAAAIVRDEEGDAFCDLWRTASDDAAWLEIVATMERHHRSAASVDAFAEALGCGRGVSGYAYHSVPVALYAWLRHRGDPAACFLAILRCGGDTDTIGAIAGALLGTDGGAGCFPPAWRERVVDWPLSIGRIEAAGRSLAEPGSSPVRWWWLLQPVRNLVFLAVILVHGFRRFLP